MVIKPVVQTLRVSNTDARVCQLQQKMILSWQQVLSHSDVTKALDAETEAKTESGGFETEAEAESVYLETEAEAQGSWTILFTVQSSVTTTCL